MANSPKDPMSRFFEQDIAGGKRSNFNWSYKNRLSADFCYLYPVGLFDVPSDVHFELDLVGSISSNPTLAPLLGKVKFRVEAYFIEKAAYVDRLRNNDKLPLDRDVPFPTFKARTSTRDFSPRTGILEHLQMYPAGWNSYAINGSDPNDATPSLNAIPFIMYYDIYRNYYVNPQDDNIPIRISGFIPGTRNEDNTDWDVEPTPIQDQYITRADLDSFVRNSRDSNDVDVLCSEILNFYPFGTPLTTGIITDRDHQKYRHLGLMRRTLNNDFFTSFISNSNVELMRSHANVQVNNGLVDVQQISLANRNWRIATRNMLWGTDWKDYNKVHYGVNLLIPYGKPQFLGAMSNDVIFSDVISQAQTGAQDASVTANTNLGSRAGLAFGGVKNHNGRFVEFNTKDEGYVMVLASIVPEVDYYQGIDPMYFKTNLKHSWLVEFNSVGMQDFHKAWASAVVEVPQVVTMPWDSWNESLWKVPIWFEYMAKYNQLHGDFTAENLLRYWVFARPFTDLSVLFPGVIQNVDEQPTDWGFFSTYGLPEMFNYVFANNLSSDNFQMQFRFDCKVSSMLDKQVVSYL